MRKPFLRPVAMALLLAAALAGCAPPAPPVYRAAVAGGPGYAERRLEDRRHRISYRGDTRTPRETVEVFLLFRAAELTLAEGRDHFRVLRQDVTPDTTYYGPAVGVGAGWSTGRRRRVGFGIGPGVPLGPVARPSTRWEAVAEIVLYDGPKPADAPDAYDARDVIRTLRDDVPRLP